MNDMQHQRRGTVMLAALVVLIVIGAMLAGVVGASLRGNREQRRQVHARQAQLMLDAGINKAVNAMELNTNYEGELWELTRVFPQFSSATVEISVQREEAEAGKRVTVRARVQPDTAPEQATQISTSFTWPTEN